MRNEYHKIGNKLNLGCGFDIQEGYINQDMQKFNGVDLVFDFNNKFPIDDNSFYEIRIKDCIHCVNNLSDFMNEVWRISKPNAKIEIETVCFLSPINCQDIYFKTHIGYNSFDLFMEKNYYASQAQFVLEKRKWIFSDNKKLKWLSFIPNLFPKFYARFGYFYFPSNKLKFILRVVK